MPEINEQYNWPTGSHPDCIDPDAVQPHNNEVALIQAMVHQQGAGTVGAQDVPPPLVTGRVTVLDEVDLLRYTLLVERAQKLQLLLEKQATEFRLTQDQQQTNGNELGVLLDHLGVKYGVDFHNNRIEPNGKVMPCTPR